LLYAGTETGMYISFDDGTSSNPFQINLPIVPITDLTIKNDNLIAATQGRSFWLIDDLTPLHQLDESIASSEVHLYQPMPSYRIETQTSFEPKPKNAGNNHPGGVLIHYFIKDQLDSADVLNLDILDGSGEVIRTFTNKIKEGKEKPEMVPNEGMNRQVWDMRYEEAEKFEGLIMWGAGTVGPLAMPGVYHARLTLNEQIKETSFEILADPRSESSNQDYRAQFDFLKEVRDKVSETHLAIKSMRQVKKQVSAVQDKIKGEEAFEEVIIHGDSLKSAIDAVEKALYQTKNKSAQDPLNYPIRLNNKLAALSRVGGTGNHRPTDQAVKFKDEVIKEIDQNLDTWKKILNDQIPEFNELVKSKGVDAVVLDEDQVITP